MLRASASRTSPSWSYWVPVVAYATLIFYMSSLTHPEDYMPSFLEEVGDGVLHAIEYGVLGVLCYRAFRYAAGAWAARYALLLAIVASVGYGFTDELHQAFVPTRDPDGWDVVADSVGACVGALAWRRVAGPL